MQARNVLKRHLFERQWISTILALSTIFSTSCKQPADFNCAMDFDCPKGQICADGFCTVKLNGDASASRDLLFKPDGQITSDSSPIHDGMLGDSGTSSCQANQNDQIERKEMPIVVGASITYSMGSELVVDLQGKDVAGKRHWSLTADALNETTMVSQLLPIFPWAKNAFPHSTYVSLLDQSLGTFGVYSVSEKALTMDGVISEKADQTRLTYNVPVELLRFPLIPQDHFVTESDVSGPINNIPVWLHETYEVEVLGAGQLEIPTLVLNVLLVQIKVKQYPKANPFYVTTRVMFLFVSECYGIVARIVVEKIPSKLDQVQAKERWRISF